MAFILKAVGWMFSFAKILRKVDTSNEARDAHGRFAQYDHVKLITGISSDTPNLSGKIKKSPAFIRFMMGLIGQTVDTRTLPYGENVASNVKVANREDYLVGKDTLTFSPTFLEEATAYHMALSIGDYNFQNIILGQSHRYSRDKLHWGAIVEARTISEQEVAQTSEDLREVFNNVFAHTLLATPFAGAWAEKYPHVSTMVHSLIGGRFFNSTQ